MTKLIAVHKDGQEGGIHIDATGKVITKADDRPDWADGYAQALLDERKDFFTARLGAVGAESLLAADIMAADELGWLAVDAEGSEVEVEADGEYRMNLIAKAMGIDLTDIEQERNFKTAIAQADVDHTYSTRPTEEATLAEVEGKGFQEAERRAATA